MKNLKGWIITLVGALFFFYAFFQANIMTSINGELSKFFGVSSAQIGLLSASFFYANIIFIIPAGLILDRFSIKMLMGVNILIAIAGSLIFAFSETILMASIGRFLTGIMMSFGLIICLKLASVWLPSHRMALASSLIVTIGMIGGVVSQAPIAYLVRLLGWQGAVLVGSIFGLSIGIVLWFIVKDPKNRVSEIEKTQKMPILKSLYLVFKEPQNWFCGLFTCFLNLPIAILGALFGISYVMHVYEFTLIQSASITSMIFFGMIFGSPFFGWFSDYLRLRKVPMVIGAFLCLIFMLIAIYVQTLGFASLHVLFFLIGFTSAAQVLGYPVISESNPSQITGSALSLASFLIMGLGYGLGLPFIGKLLDSLWDGKIVSGIHTYSVQSYQKAFLTIPIGILISIFMIFFMKETKCKPLVK